MLHEEVYDADEILREYDDFDHDDAESEEPIDELDFENKSGELLDDTDAEVVDGSDLLT